MYSAPSILGLLCTSFGLEGHIDPPTEHAADLIGLLERNIREDNVARDAAALAPAMRRAFGNDRARMMLMDAKKRATDKQSKKILDNALSGRK